jgi:(R,R)-butanediol dehydrogenase/meso-butanediol dehydrogenase/diacetyl reductase
VTATMRALRFHGARDLRLEQVPVPTPGPDEVLVAVERVGICGTDLEEYLAGPVGIPAAAAAAGVILGHEIVGRVVETLEPVVRLGDRVVPDVVHGCGACWWCDRHSEHLCRHLTVLGLQVDGGLATYLRARRATCVPVPSAVDLDVAAFAEPTAVALRALRKAPDLAGATVAVVGAGTIGCLVAQLALAAGAADVIAVDPQHRRRELAASLGATVVDPAGAAAFVQARTDGRGADVVVECAGPDAAVRTATDLVRPGGTIVLVGTGAESMPLPVRSLIHREITLRGSAAHLWDVDMAPAVAALAAGQVDVRPLLTGVVPLERAVADGFHRLLSDPDVVKILIDCT